MRKGLRRATRVTQSGARRNERPSIVAACEGVILMPVPTEQDRAVTLEAENAELRAENAELRRVLAVATSAAETLLQRAACARKRL